MKLISFFWVAALLTTTGLGLKAQTDSIQVFSLLEAQNYAVENFYVSKNAKLDIDKAKKVVMETTSIGLPQVNASVSYTHIPGEIPTFDFGSSLIPLFQAIGINTDSLDLGEPSPIAERNNITYGFTVSQLIFSGEYIVGLQASKVYKSLSEEINTKTELGIKQSISDSYFAVLILEKNREILLNTLNNLEESFEQISKYYKAGFNEDTDVDQLQITLTRAQNSLKTIDRQIEILNKLFKYQLGLTNENEIILTDNIDDLITRNIVNDSTYLFNIDENIDFKMLETQEKLMELSLKRQKSTYLPTVAGFYQYQDLTNQPDLNFNLKHMIGISVQVPIFTSGGRMARVSQAKIELEEAKNKKDQEADRLYMEAEQAIYNYNSAYESYINEKSNFELSEKVYNKSNVKFKEGVISSLDLTMINNQYLQAQMTYSMAVQELLSSKIAMDKTFSKL
jgi:outer membrane protein